MLRSSVVKDLRWCSTGFWCDSQHLRMAHNPCSSPLLASLGTDKTVIYKIKLITFKIVFEKEIKQQARS